MNSTPAPAAPAGFTTLNPFFIARDVEGLITFLREVFGGEEHADARTTDVDGLLLQAELEIGGTTLMFGERKPDWPYLPQLTQIYVDDLDAVLDRATGRGARVVTQPTEFFGTMFSRIVDPWGNMWWVYKHGEVAGEWGEDAEGEGEWAADGAEGGDAEAAEWEDPGLAYIHSTLLDVMPGLGAESAK